MKSSFQERVLTPGVPKNLMLSVANECNLRCTYCFYEQGTSEYAKKVMSLAEMEDWFAQAGFGATQLIVTGGEPLLYADLPEMLERASRYFASVHLLTNATRISEELAWTLAQLGVSVDVSLDHTNLALSDAVRGGTRQTLRGVDRLLAAGVEAVNLTLVMTSANWMTVPEFVTYCRERGVTAEVSIAGVAEEHPLNLRHLTKEERVALIRSLHAGSDVMRETSVTAVVAAILRAEAPRLSGCAFAESSLFVDADGTAYICPFQMAHPVGCSTDAPEDIGARRASVFELVRPGTCVSLECFALARGA